MKTTKKGRRIEMKKNIFIGLVLQRMKSNFEIHEQSCFCLAQVYVRKMCRYLIDGEIL